MVAAVPIGAVGASPSSTASSPSSSWATQILSALEAPLSQNNISKLAAWNACEGNVKSGLGINNPFNTTLDAPGALTVNSDGVKLFPTLAEGIGANVAVIQESRYKAILANLQSDGTASDFASAVGSSPWGSSGTCIANALGTTPSLSPAAYTGGGLSGSGTVASGGSGSSGCFLSLPSVDLVVTSVGGGCLITNSELKALKGALLVASGAVVFGLGVLVLTAYGLESTKAGQRAAKATRTVAKVTPSGSPANAVKKASSAPARRSAPAAQAQRVRLSSTAQRGARSTNAFGQTVRSSWGKQLTPDEQADDEAYRRRPNQAALRRAYTADKKAHTVEADETSPRMPAKRFVASDGQLF